MAFILPYTSLRSFEAVARLHGFARAAEELGITQSAVSQHVRAVEEWIGCKLFIRGQRKSTATEEGERLAIAIREGFGNIEKTVLDLRRKDRATREITVYCPPGFAVKWLFPRLMRFDELHPDIPISISTQLKHPNSLSGREEISIGYGPGLFSGQNVQKIMEERIFPVCAGGILSENCTVADMADKTLLVDDIEDLGGQPPTWEYWSKMSKHKLPQEIRRRRFSQSNMALQAAELGMGIALGREPLVLDALEQGRLVRPFGEVVGSHHSYWLVMTPEAAERDRNRKFKDWILAEAAEQKAKAAKIIT